jgi:hypothetical protein
LKATERRGPDHLALVNYLLSITKENTSIFLAGDSFKSDFYRSRLSNRDVHVMNYGDNTYNSAITELNVSGNLKKCVVSVIVSNFSLQPLDGVITLEGEFGYRQNKKIKLTSVSMPDTSESLIIFKKFHVKRVQQIFRVKFTRKSKEVDLLPDDDQVLFRIIEGKSLVVCIGTDKSLKRILTLQPGIMARYFSPSEFISSRALVEHADLFISSGYIDDFLIHKPLILFHPMSNSGFTTGRTS